RETHLYPRTVDNERTARAHRDGNYPQSSPPDCGRAYQCARRYYAIGNTEPFFSSQPEDGNELALHLPRPEFGGWDLSSNRNPSIRAKSSNAALLNASFLVRGTPIHNSLSPPC